jgi:hypothetical protein
METNQELLEEKGHSLESQNIKLKIGDGYESGWKVIQYDDEGDRYFVSPQKPHPTDNRLNQWVKRENFELE